MKLPPYFKTMLALDALTIMGFVLVFLIVYGIIRLVWSFISYIF